MNRTLALLRRRWEGSYEVDPWGYDPELVALLDPVLRLRVPVEIEGLEHLPSDGPAVLTGRRLAVLAAAVGQATGRPVRPLGVPDIDLVGPALRRLGGVPLTAPDLAALLRAGQLCAVPPRGEGLVGDRDVPVLRATVRARFPRAGWRVSIHHP